MAMYDLIRSHIRKFCWLCNSEMVVVFEKSYVIVHVPEWGQLVVGSWASLKLLRSQRTSSMENVRVLVYGFEPRHLPFDLHRYSLQAISYFQSLWRHLHALPSRLNPELTSSEGYSLPLNEKLLTRGRGLSSSAGTVLEYICWCG